MARGTKTGAGANRALREPQQERSRATRQRLLEAAVDCLLEVGYANLTTTQVSTRAHVSRGAQQHHFPHKAALMAEAVNQLHERIVEEYRRRARRLPPDGDRVEEGLQSLWAIYKGKSFTAALELSVAAKYDTELRAIVGPWMQQLDKSILSLCEDIFGEEISSRPAFETALETSLGTIRGLAVLQLFHHPRRAMERQWENALAELIPLFGIDAKRRRPGQSSRRG